jgi:peptide chain release factor subunit 1
MQTNEITPERLRSLAALRPEGARVLSVYLDLEPSRFATAAARSTQVTSLLDEAERAVRAQEGLSHEVRMALRADVERLRDWFRNGGFDAKGAHGLAVFCCGPAGLFETLKLARPVEGRVVVDTSPWIEPLAEMGRDDRWAVLLVSRRTGRILRGTPDRLEEVEDRVDDVHGRHDQGGWSQANYERSIDADVAEHVRQTISDLFRELRRAPFDRLLIGTPTELSGDVQSALHPYLRDRLAGRIEVDVEATSAEDVRRAAAPAIEEDQRRRERAALDRLEEGLGAGGRAAAGLDDVLGTLNERRVETLLLTERHRAPGVVCPRDGWLGVAEERCPLDGEATAQRDDVVEPALEAALAQSASILVVRHHDDLDRHGLIAALLRF